MAIVEDPRRFPDPESRELTVIYRTGKGYLWLMDEPGSYMSVQDLRDWLKGCAGGREVHVAQDQVGILLGHQTGDLPTDPDSVTWLDAASRRWSVMAPQDVLSDTRLIALARLVRSTQRISCLPLVSSYCA